MYYIGIDIGSTAAKVAVFKDNELFETFVMPTGWSSIEASNLIKDKLYNLNIPLEESKIVATGYGRVSVPYAHKTITEISCHGKGASYLNESDCTVIDIGGQDTKIITVENGMVSDFLMNDKCSAGTGRFLDIMANSLGLDINSLCDLARTGSGITISSMCTVFAESEVISLIGQGVSKNDIAYGIIDSIVSKVKSLCSRHSSSKNFFLTGGLCQCDYIVEQLSAKLDSQVKTHELARYAGAVGAALLSKKVK